MYTGTSFEKIISWEKEGTDARTRIAGPRKRRQDTIDDVDGEMRSTLKFSEACYRSDRLFDCPKPQVKTRRPFAWMTSDTD